ncbi:uncharacterized protein BJ212DRAFT_1301430 [Suillus subaureus]|uniref:Uncharacterized protein n=1 Tax=Suillus subaureus TaxID=48587 RepID=A0A9P7E712_9AGAM|nr:uncharacterized protein BJ212DRAFT_1301430 [Suillus subaureus]KAG1812405.1 hypothetical protein BJ212DRAFT_1301430 [Suillus subaureus]
MLHLVEEGYTIAEKICSNSQDGVRQLCDREDGEWGKRMDIIMIHWNCVIAPILQFHSTVAMNYITAESNVGMNPEWKYLWEKGKFVYPCLHIEDERNPFTVRAPMKYTERGFKLYADLFKFGQHECKTSTQFPHAMRTTVHDRMFYWSVNTVMTIGMTTAACAACRSRYDSSEVANVSREVTG